MYHLQETSLEWSLLHLTNYYDSDFFPRLFEFEAIKRDWTNIKSYLRDLDLEKYAPKSPVIYLALKPNNNYRVVHQLDPIDSILYSALLYENATIIETYRIPEIRKIACSYRIKPEINGSYFEKDYNGYGEFLEKAESLADKFDGGVVLICDVVDFYNQIYLHRVNNVLSEAGSKAGKIIEDFLGGLNANVSRGIPVGPAPSILIAEAIMSDINKKILGFTHSFVQYVDDVYIFFDEDYDAKTFLHELTKYLYSNHRLVLSPDKTKILDIDDFKTGYLKEESRVEKDAIHKKLEGLSSHYSSPEETKDFDKLEAPEKLKIRSETYLELFDEALKFEQLELGLMRHILRQAGRYKIRNIIPKIFKHFDKLLPVIREIVIYFERVLNEATAKKYEKDFSELLENPYLTLPFINMWVFTLFQNEHFNSLSIKINYSKIIRIREKALIAKRERNLTFIKDIKDGIDTLGIWDRRAVLYSSFILSEDEVKHWLGLESSKGDVVNKSICSMIIGDKKAAR
jgi:hypothetical protein